MENKILRRYIIVDPSLCHGELTFFVHESSLQMSVAPSRQIEQKI